ncbi:MAG: NAD(P)/FAD-dependent oxidoreductase, partial [Propionibacteriaceae bacterium]
MSMFDYDARPVTPGVVLVGGRASRGAYAIRDFLSRNGYPFEWVDADRADVVAAVVGAAGVEPSALPLCILPDGSRLASATVEQVAAGLGMVTAPSLPEYDLVIVGAGPAGLAAAVYAGSEGLRTVMIEKKAPGGQAGSSSFIENYLGFPKGLSGADLARRAATQALRFGVEIVSGEAVRVGREDPYRTVALGDGTTLRCHA